MKISFENKKYIIYICKYLGVALIAGSVVHVGTLDSGSIRYILLGIIGVILMMIGNISEAKQEGNKIDLNFLLTLTGLSIATGFLSGGVQHYLDNPSYAGILLGLGLSIAYITFFIKENMQVKSKNIVIVILISLIIIFFSNYFMDDKILGTNHHSGSVAEISNKH